MRWNGRMIRRLGLPTAVVGVLGCMGGGATEMDDVGLDDLRRTYLAAYNAGQIEAMASVYTPDAVRMPYDAPLQDGRDAILDFYRRSFGARRYEPTLTFRADGIQALGDVAIERGSYREELRPIDGGASLLEIGKYVVVARRGSDGAWRYATTIFNRDGLPGPLTPSSP